MISKSRKLTPTSNTTTNLTNDSHRFGCKTIKQKDFDFEMSND